MTYPINKFPFCDPTKLYSAPPLTKAVQSMSSSVSCHRSSVVFFLTYGTELFREKIKVTWCQIRRIVREVKYHERRVCWRVVLMKKGTIFPQQSFKNLIGSLFLLFGTQSSIITPFMSKKAITMALTWLFSFCALIGVLLSLVIY